MKLEGIDHVAIAVPDMGQTVAWYTEVLGLQRLHVEEWDGVPAFVGIGTTALAFFPQDEKTRGRGPMLHLAFRADRAGFVRAQDELQKRGIAFHFEDHGIAHSIYFRDLNDLRLEITTYDVYPGSLIPSALALGAPARIEPVSVCRPAADAPFVCLPEPAQTARDLPKGRADTKGRRLNKDHG